jgi:hypothetical protein
VLHKNGTGSGEQLKKRQIIQLLQFVEIHNAVFNILIHSTAVAEGLALPPHGPTVNPGSTKDRHKSATTAQAVKGCTAAQPIINPFSFR